jgi:peptide deformylase
MPNLDCWVRLIDMAVKPILRMGDARLLEPSKPVTNVPSSELDALVQDLFDTMAANDGAGLAAPQIGVNLQVVVFGFKENQRYPDAEQVPETVLVNPVITPLSDDLTESWEGCLSVPGMRGLVPRYESIHYTGIDQQGNPIDRKVSGFHAIVVQHECDHLEGILYPMRMPDMSLFGFDEELTG